MKIISTSYVKVTSYSRPERWIERISFYAGILATLAKEHNVVSIEKINYEGVYEQNGVQYYFIRQKKQTVLFPFAMHRLIKKLSPDVVFINGFIFPLQIIQLRIKMGKAVKIIVINRSEKPFRRVKKYLQRLADKCVNAYFFVSKEFGDEWIENGNIQDKNKIHEVMHGSSAFSPVDKNNARSKLSVSGNPVFLWVGRLNANKDPITVVKAFIKFISLVPTAKLYMIYQTEELLKDIHDLIDTNKNAAEAIRLVGHVAHDELQFWYSSADFFVSGSHYEGGGIALCEAMSCGCIPIVTNIVSFRAITGSGKCGLLYEPGNSDDLFSAFIKAREMKREEEREKAIRQFNNELSFEAIAVKINQVINIPVK